MKYFTGEQYKLRYAPELDGVDPLQHYNQYGRFEGRDCSFPEGWNAEDYLSHPDNADVKADPVWGAQPELHWLLAGAREGRKYRKETLPLEIPKRPGPFFMAGMPFPDGHRIGTYKDNEGYAHFLKYDGQYKTLWSGFCESVYHIQRRKCGRAMFSLECPAAVVIENADGSFNVIKLRGEVDSLAFDIWPFRGGWMVFTTSNILYRRAKIFTSMDDGETWQLYKEHQSPEEGKFVQCCTDDQDYWLYGDKDRFPYVEDEHGKQVILMKDYKEQTINYASIRSGLFTFGMNNIDPLISDGTRRNGYVMFGTTGGMYHSGIDLKPPFVMQTDIRADGLRLALASIWREDGYPNPQLAKSTDGRTWKESDVVSLPFPSCQTTEFGDGGVFCYGGKFGEYGQWCFVKL